MVVENLESSGNLVYTGSPSDIEEVSGFSSVEFYNVHGCHCQSGPVHHAPDVTVQSHVVQTGFSCLFFVFVRLFRSQTVLLHLHQFTLSEFSVVIYVQFSVYAEQFIGRVSGPRVDFQLN